MNLLTLTKNKQAIIEKISDEFKNIFNAIGISEGNRISLYLDQSKNIRCYLIEGSMIALRSKEARAITIKEKR